MPSDESQDLNARTPTNPAAELIERVWGSPEPSGDADPSGAAGEFPATIGRFRIGRVLGRGGYGIVFLATDPDLDRPVALKVARPEYAFDPSSQDRMLREARLSAKLRHSGIVTVHEIGPAGPVWYMASEVCDGPDLDAWLKSRPELPPIGRAVELLIAIAEAVEFAHQQGVIHRDLKPANVLLFGGTVPKVSDFGLAKLLDGGPDQSKTGAIAGTPSYMSPEQAAGEKTLGMPTDVYALGAILYELLTGRPPFRGETKIETLRLVSETEPVSPRRLRPDVPRDLETICLKCLEKSPERRYPSAAALGEDLRRFAEGRAIVARPLGPAQLAWRAVKRNALVSVLAAAILLSLITGTGVSIAYALKAAANERAANAATGEAITERNVAVAQKERADRLLNAQLLQSSLQHWESGKPEAAVETLGRTPERFRGWEHRYLSHRYSSLGQRTIGSGAGILRGVVVTKDGRLAVTASEDGHARVWDVTEGGEVRRIGDGSMPLRSIALAPDGTVALGRDDGAVLTWDPAAGTDSTSTQVTLPAGPVVSVAFSSDGTHAAAIAKGELWVWRRADLEPERLGTFEDAQHVSFSRDGRRLVSSSRGGAYRVWDAESRKLIDERTGPPLGFLFARFTPDGTGLISGGSDFRLRTWDLGTMGPAEEHPWGSPVMSLRLSPSGKRCVTTTAEGKVRVAAIKENGFSVLHDLIGHTGKVANACFDSEGRRVVSAGTDGTVRVWSLDLGQDDLVVPDVLSGRLDFHPDGTKLAVGGASATVLDPATGKELRSFPGRTRAVAFHPDGGSLAIGMAGGTVVIHPLSDGGTPTVVTMGVVADRLAFSPDGDRLAVGGIDGSLSVFDLPSNKKAWAAGVDHGGFTSGLAYSPDGDTVASAGNDGKVHLWGAETGESIRSIDGHEGKVYSQDFSPDGLTFASAGKDRLVKIWDARSGELLRTLEGSPSYVWCCEFGPEGRRLFTGSHGEAARVWDAEHGDLLLALPRRGCNWVYDLAVSPNGGWAAALEFFQEDTGNSGMRLRIFQAPHR